MTGNCAALAALADEPGYAQISTADAARTGIGMKSWYGLTRVKAGHYPCGISDRPNKGAIYADLPVVDWRM